MSDDTNAGDGSPQDAGGQPAQSNQGAPPPPPASASPPPAATPPPQYQQGPGPDPSGQYQQVPGPDSTGQIQYVVQRTGPSLNLAPNLVFAVLAVAGIALSIFIKESPGQGAPKVNLWDQLNGLWCIAAIVAAVATLLPALRTVVNLDEKTAWNIAAGAAGFLVFWWVVFILPILSFNVCFIATVAVVAAILAAWTSPGNTYKSSVDTAATP